MKRAAASTPPSGLKPLLAKLVIGITAVVALATSAPPRWQATETRQASVALEGDSARKLRLTIELTGELYADVIAGNVVVSVVANRAASDLTLNLRPLAPGRDSSGSAGAAPAAQPDAGSSSLTARPALDSPNRAALWLGLACPSVAERGEACVEHFEITLTRDSELPLTADLNVVTTLDGERERRPAGTFDVRLEETPP